MVYWFRFLTNRVYILNEVLSEINILSRINICTSSKDQFNYNFRLILNKNRDHENQISHSIFILDVIENNISYFNKVVYKQSDCHKTISYPNHIVLRYCEGVIFSCFLKVEEKCSYELNPHENAALFNVYPPFFK